MSARKTARLLTTGQRDEMRIPEEDAGRVRREAFRCPTRSIERRSTRGESEIRSNDKRSVTRRPFVVLAIAFDNARRLGLASAEEEREVDTLRPRVEQTCVVRPPLVAPVPVESPTAFAGVVHERASVLGRAMVEIAGNGTP